MISETHTIIVASGKERRKLLKIIYGKDGSLYILSPYHPIPRAVVFKGTVNYSEAESKMHYDELIEVAVVDDDEKRLKLSHHLSGFIQISGDGIVSGIEKDGTVKGIGIQSWRLDGPVAGPAFGVAIYGYECFKKVQQLPKDAHLFLLPDIDTESKKNAIIIECYCFPAAAREKIRQDNNGRDLMQIPNPSGRELTLSVASPPISCECQTFLGIEVRLIDGIEGTPSPSFYLSSSTGNMRTNSKGETLGDAIYCAFPQPKGLAGRSLNRCEKSL